MMVISEREFSQAIRLLLKEVPTVNSVTGPGRSGAIAAVYASHALHIPFIPYGQEIPEDLKPVLIIDTAIESGCTLKKAFRKYINANPVIRAVYREPPRVIFWYEPMKPQYFKKRAA